MTTKTEAEEITVDQDEDDSADSIFETEKTLEQQYAETLGKNDSEDSAESEKAPSADGGPSENSEVTSPPTDSVAELAKSVKALVEHQTKAGESTEENKKPTIPEKFELDEDEIPDGFLGLSEFLQTQGAKQLDQLKAVRDEAKQALKQVQQFRDEIDVKFLMQELGVDSAEEKAIAEFAGKRGFQWKNLDMIRDLVADHRKLHKPVRKKNPNPPLGTRSSGNADSETRDEKQVKGSERDREWEKIKAKSFAQLKAQGYMPGVPSDDDDDE